MSIVLILVRAVALRWKRTFEAPYPRSSLPYMKFHNMSDSDLVAVISFLRSQALGAARLRRSG